MQNISTKLVAAASIISQAMAQLPRECFYVTEMHGRDQGDADLLSDLPTLMAMYKPGMKLNSIVAMQDPDFEDNLTGLKVNLYSQKHSYLELPTIGSQVDNWSSEKLSFHDVQPDRISILTDD